MESPEKRVGLDNPGFLTLNTNMTTLHTPDSPDSSKRRSTPSTVQKLGRKKRARLSCLECRKKKLSCDRDLPCHRCIKAGRRDECSFDTAPASAAPSSTELIVTRQQDPEQIQHLQAEVARLKELLSKAPLTGHGKYPIASVDLSNGQDRPEDEAEARQIEQNAAANALPNRGSGPAHPLRRSPRGYYNQHSLFRFFGEIHELFPFIKETARQWFEPLGVHIQGSKSTTDIISGPAPNMDALIPPRDDADELVRFYIDNLEHFHRVLHVPTFQREYEKFWSEQPRHPWMTVLILAIMSISTSVSRRTPSDKSTFQRYRDRPTQWVATCNYWLYSQGFKRRGLIYYQISCLVYVAKRASMIRKKSFWKDTASLIQDAVIDGLHYDPQPGESLYSTEMKKRIWATIRELDIQNCLEYGLPSLLHSLPSITDAPTNLNDDDFDELSTEFGTAKPLRQYNSVSFQIECSRSWSLRLEVSRRLYSSGSQPLNHEEVLRYTDSLIKAVDEIPPWDDGGKPAAYARAILECQLRECIISLHRPYLRKKEQGFWVSRTVCYQTACDILLLHTKLAALGLHGFTVPREDLLLASLTLTHVIMLEPPGSQGRSSLIGAHSTVDLLEECLPFMEDRYLQCCHDEPWCFLTIYAAYMLIKIHLGKETPKNAQALCARRYLDLHSRRTQQVSSIRQGYLTPDEHAWNNMTTTATPPTRGAHADAVTANAHEEEAVGIPNLGFDTFGFDMDTNLNWNSWDPPWLFEDIMEPSV